MKPSRRFSFCFKLKAKVGFVWARQALAAEHSSHLAPISSFEPILPLLPASWSSRSCRPRHLSPAHSSCRLMRKMKSSVPSITKMAQPAAKSALGYASVAVCKGRVEHRLTRINRKNDTVRCRSISEEHILITTFQNFPPQKRAFN